MIGALPIAHANYSGPAYTAVFYRTGCSGDLSTNIQARFEWDVSGGNNTNTMAIKEYGTNSQYSVDNGDGYFKFDEEAMSPSYSIANGSIYYPSIQAYVYVRQYNIDGVGFIMQEPVYDSSHAPKFFNLTRTVPTYNANLSSARDELQIQIIQSLSPNAAVEAEFNLISSSGVNLMTWTASEALQNYTNGLPEYTNVAVSDVVNGLQERGYANFFSGTDFQIESVIHPSTLTDFLGYDMVTYHDLGVSNANKFSLPPPCNFTSFVDEEGDGATFSSSSTTGTKSVSNEAYQYVKVT